VRRRPYEVRYAPIAETQIEAALLWWERNRRAATDLLARELHQAFDLLAVAPQVGRRVRFSGHAGIRRLLLQVSGYHVYYQLLDVDREVRIVYFRHARRRPLRAR
jgi:plasmid stabilization system protein ParE